MTGPVKSRPLGADTHTMDATDAHHDQVLDDPSPSPWSGSRRSLLVAAAACCATLAGARFSGGRVGADGGVARLDDAGTALATAERLSLRPEPTPDPDPTPVTDVSAVPDGMLAFPVQPGSDCYVLDNFGDARGSTRLHQGVDIMGSAGNEVIAVASGVLTKRYTNTGTAGWGWTLEDESTDTIYKYFHLAEDPAGLDEGDTVTVGQVIGYVGKSGTFGDDNYHLHFEVRPNNVAIDPLPLLVVDRDACGVSPPIRA